VTTSRAHYLDTLGIPGYLYASKNLDNSNTKLIQAKCLVIETQCTESVCEPGIVQDFLYKMLSAVGLDKQDVVCIQSPIDKISQEICKYNAQAILVMDAQASPIKDKVFIIQHPGHILKNDQLKRKAWEVLKKIKSCLK
jgi:hypothetical protein